MGSRQSVDILIKGELESSSLSFEKDIKYIRRINSEIYGEGDVIFFYSEGSSAEYFLQQTVFTDKIQFTKHLEMAKRRKIIKMKNLIPLENIYIVQHSDYCNSYQKINYVYPFHPTTLADEIQSQIFCQNAFSVEDVLNMLESVLSALIYLADNSIVHQNLKPSSIVVNSNCNPEEKYMISNIRFHLNLQVNIEMLQAYPKINITFLSPEELAELSYSYFTFNSKKEQINNLQDLSNSEQKGNFDMILKKSVFTLGMIALEMVSLLNSADLYDLHNFCLNKIKVQKRIETIKHYPISCLIETMLTFCQEKRISAKEARRVVGVLREQLQLRESTIFDPEVQVFNKQLNTSSIQKKEEEEEKYQKLQTKKTCEQSYERKRITELQKQQDNQDFFCKFSECIKRDSIKDKIPETSLIMGSHQKQLSDKIQNSVQLRGAQSTTTKQRVIVVEQDRKTKINDERISCQKLNKENILSVCQSEECKNFTNINHALLNQTFHSDSSIQRKIGCIPDSQHKRFTISEGDLKRFSTSLNLQNLDFKIPLGNFSFQKPDSLKYTRDKQKQSKPGQTVDPYLLITRAGDFQHSPFQKTEYEHKTFQRDENFSEKNIISEIIRIQLKDKLVFDKVDNQLFLHNSARQDISSISPIFQNEQSVNQQLTFYRNNSSPSQSQQYSYGRLQHLQHSLSNLKSQNDFLINKNKQILDKQETSRIQIDYLFNEELGGINQGIKEDFLHTNFLNRPQQKQQFSQSKKSLSYKRLIDKSPRTYLSVQKQQIEQILHPCSLYQSSQQNIVSMLHSNKIMTTISTQEVGMKDINNGHYFQPSQINCINLKQNYSPNNNQYQVSKIPSKMDQNSTTDKQNVNLIKKQSIESKSTTSLVVSPKNRLTNSQRKIFLSSSLNPLDVFCPWTTTTKFDKQIQKQREDKKQTIDKTTQNRYIQKDKENLSTYQKSKLKLNTFLIDKISELNLMSNPTNMQINHTRKNSFEICLGTKHTANIYSANPIETVHQLNDTKSNKIQAFVYQS